MACYCVIIIRKKWVKGIRMHSDLINICFYMKDAAFAAGDVLNEGFQAVLQKDGRLVGKKSSEAAMSVLLDKWFAARDESVAVLFKEMAEPVIARERNGVYTQEDFEGEWTQYEGPCFCISGLDGSLAYERGIRDFDISLAYIENRQVMAGVVFDPVHVELFHAADGMGAYLNGKRISAAGTAYLADAYISAGSRVLRTADEHVLRRLSEQVLCMRTAASCGLELCYAACGRVDASIGFGRHFCDCAAGLLIAKEAGAVLLDKDGCEYTDVPVRDERMNAVAAAPGIQKELAEILTDLRGVQ